MLRSAKLSAAAVTALVAACASTGSEAGGSRSAGAAPSRPNVVLVFVDDLGAGELGCYGQEHIQTPNIDRMAREGMRFTRFYAGAPVCGPSRCVLMTGKHLAHATVRNNQPLGEEGQLPISASETTLAEVLEDAGLTGGAFGKWGLGMPGSDGDPLARGFDRFFGYNCQKHAHNFYPRYLWDDDERRPLEGNDRGLTGAQYSHDLIDDELEAFVRANAERPFFVYMPSTLPHLALQVPDETLALYDGAFEETPYTGRSYLPHPTPRAAYAAMITHLDRSVGRLLRLLDELGLAEETLVLFTSDNGPTHVKAQVDVDFFDSAGGLRGLKGSVYEGGLRVPLVARWPGQVEAGCESDHICAFQDLMPTLADVTGGSCPENIDGLSFLPTLLGRTAEQELHDTLVWDFPGYGGQHAVLAGRWKLVRRGLRKKGNSAWELYDLVEDPTESRDLAGAHPELVETISGIFLGSRTRPEWEAFQFGEYADD